MLLLNVPFKEKEEAKQLGAKWCPNLKKWGIERPQDYPKFFRWFPEVEKYTDRYIIFDYIYIVVGVHTCKSCKYQTVVVAFAIEKYFDVDGCHMNKDDRYGQYDYNFEEDDSEGSLILVGNLHLFPNNELDNLRKNIVKICGEIENDDTGYTIKHAEGCRYRNSMKGSYFFLGEKNSIFNFWNEHERAYTNNEAYQKVIFYKYHLENEYFCGICSHNHLEKEDFYMHANIKEYSEIYR